MRFMVNDAGDPASGSPKQGYSGYKTPFRPGDRIKIVNWQHVVVATGKVVQLYKDDGDNEWLSYRCDKFHDLVPALASQVYAFKEVIPPQVSTFEDGPWHRNSLPLSMPRQDYSK